VKIKKCHWHEDRPAVKDDLALSGHFLCRDCVKESRRSYVVEYIGGNDMQKRWGQGQNPDGILEIGQTYEVVHTEIHTWHTCLHLKGIEGKYNSSLFKDTP